MIRRGGRFTLAAFLTLTLATAVAVCWSFAILTPPAGAQQAAAAGTQAKPGAKAGAAGAQAGAAGAATGQKGQRSTTSSTRTGTSTTSTGPGSPAAGAAGKPASGAQGSAGNSAGSATSAPPPDMGNIDQILEGDEEVLAGNSFTYDPGNRRDPFKSLLIAADRPEFRGPRPEGIPGLLIDEIDLKGVFRTARGYVAQVTASNQKKSYLLKEGDQLYDGDVVSIGKNEVVFKQIVQDPSALKPFREVVKSLNPQ
jgi:Tfp pilus assembly protein PilP